MTDIIKDGVSNPYGTILDQGFGDGDPQEEEANNEETDGIPTKTQALTKMTPPTKKMPMVWKTWKTK